MHKLPGLAMVLFCGVALSATYKWVDKDGVVHYSDRPTPGAETVNLPTAQTYEPRDVIPPPNTQDAKPNTSSQYTELSIWRPNPDEVFVNEQNTITAKVRVEPDLKPGHGIWLFLDGRRVQNLPTAATEFQIGDVWRGTHTLTATLVDAGGVELKRSAAVTFHMRQVSVVNRPKTPTPPPPPRRP